MLTKSDIYTNNNGFDSNNFSYSVIIEKILLLRL